MSLAHTLYTWNAVSRRQQNGCWFDTAEFIIKTKAFVVMLHVGGWQSFSLGVAYTATPSIDGLSPTWLHKVPSCSAPLCSSCIQLYCLRLVDWVSLGSRVEDHPDLQTEDSIQFRGMDHSTLVQPLGYSPWGGSSPSPLKFALLSCSFPAPPVERMPSRQPTAWLSNSGSPAEVTRCFRTRVRVQHSAAINSGIAALETSSLGAIIMVSMNYHRINCCLKATALLARWMRPCQALPAVSALSGAIVGPIANHPKRNSKLLSFKTPKQVSLCHRIEASRMSRTRVLPLCDI